MPVTIVFGSAGTPSTDCWKDTVSPSGRQRLFLSYVDICNSGKKTDQKTLLQGFASLRLCLSCGAALKQTRIFVSDGKQWKIP